MRLAQDENNEAARYRRRLREVEAERNALTERLGATQRGQVDRLVEQAGIRPAALWASGARLDALLAEDGAVDAAKVTEAITAAVEQLGIQRPSGQSRKPKENLRGGSDPKYGAGPGWAELLRGAR